MEPRTVSLRLRVARGGRRSGVVGRHGEASASRDTVVELTGLTLVEAERRLTAAGGEQA